MIIGNCAEAKRFIEYQLQTKYLIFVGDISSSSDVNDAILKQQESAVKKALVDYPDKVFVYVSSTSVLDDTAKASPYVMHRLAMENLIAVTAKKYLIFRAPQIVTWDKKNKSLMNFLVQSVKDGNEFVVWENATRNFIDIDDFFIIANQILDMNLYTNRTLNIANPYSNSVSETVSTIEKFLDKKSKHSLEKKGSSYLIDTSEIEGIASALKISFGPEYLTHLLEKYYSPEAAIHKTLSIVVPTYFEEKGIGEFYRRTKNVLSSIEERFDHEIIFVNDGSTDRTLEKLIQISKRDDRVKIINFARNFGNQYAITAGLKRASGDAVIIIDDDLQDPPEVMLNFISRWQDGYKVVYGVRRKRKGINFLFNFLAKVFYRILYSLSEVHIPVDTGDFRLLDRAVVDSLLSLDEENRFFRGLVSWVGFSQIGWMYDRDPRFAGETTFTLKKYIGFAFNGLTGFSEKPLYIASYVGFLMTGLGFLFSVWIILERIFDPSFSIQGWSSQVTIIVFFGGMQSLFIGILGVYIGKIYKQVKKRPLYIVEKEYGFKP